MHLSGEVRLLVIVLLEFNDILPNGVVNAIIRFPSLQFWHKRRILFFLLSKVLLKGQSVVFLFGFTFPARATFAFSSLITISSCGSSPWVISWGGIICGNGRCAPRVIGRGFT